jgi:hypothetical protein
MEDGQQGKKGVPKYGRAFVGQAASRSSRGNPKLMMTLAGCGVFTAVCAFVPYYFSQTLKPMTSREEALSASQVRRGPFLNSGSRDAGVDKNWNLRRGVYSHKQVEPESNTKVAKDLYSSRYGDMVSPFSNKGPNKKQS